MLMGRGQILVAVDTASLADTIMSSPTRSTTDSPTRLTYLSWQEVPDA